MQAIFQGLIQFWNSLSPGAKRAVLIQTAKVVSSISDDCCEWYRTRKVEEARAKIKEIKKNDKAKLQGIYREFKDQMSDVVRREFEKELNIQG